MITVFGSINVDLVCRVDRAPLPGETVRGSDYSLIPGGKGANQALAARRGGAEVRLIGAIGSDAMANAALGELAAAGVDLSNISRCDGATGVAVVAVNRTGENTMIVLPGANRYASASSVPPLLAERNDICLLQMEVPFSENLAFARTARQARVPVILSVAPFAPLTPDEAKEFSVLIVNQQEAVEFARHLGLAVQDGEGTVTALARRLGVTIIATLGAKGAVAVKRESVIRVPSLSITPVDTTGAGDAFCGVLAASLGEGADLRSAIKRATVAGALACTRQGAQPSFPMRSEIEAAVAALS